MADPKFDPKYHETIIHEAIEEGLIDKEELLNELLKYLSDDDLAEFLGNTIYGDIVDDMLYPEDDEEDEIEEIEED